MRHPSEIEDEDTDAEPALLSDLDRLSGSACAGCGKSICGHEALFSIALGVKDAPRCLPCLATALERVTAELRDDLTEHFRHRRCYGRAWELACRREGPACPWIGNGSTVPSVRVEAAPVVEVTVSDEWDAGDMACGDLVLALRIRLNGLAPGSVLQVTARDPAAPLDLPAWCRLTGHRLLAAAPPVYRIQRKEN